MRRSVARHRLLINIKKLLNVGCFSLIRKAEPDPRLGQARPHHAHPRETSTGGDLDTTAWRRGAQAAAAAFVGASRRDQAGRAPYKGLIDHPGGVGPFHVGDGCLHAARRFHARGRLARLLHRYDDEHRGFLADPHHIVMSRRSRRQHPHRGGDRADRRDRLAQFWRFRPSPKNIPSIGIWNAARCFARRTPLIPGYASSWSSHPSISRDQSGCCPRGTIPTPTRGSTGGLSKPGRCSKQTAGRRLLRSRRAIPCIGAMNTWPRSPSKSAMVC